MSLEIINPGTVDTTVCQIVSLIIVPEPDDRRTEEITYVWRSQDSLGLARLCLMT